MMDAAAISVVASQASSIDFAKANALNNDTMDLEQGILPAKSSKKPITFTHVMGQVSNYCGKTLSKGL